MNKIYSAQDHYLFGMFIPKGTFLNSWLSDDGNWMVELTVNDRYRIIPNNHNVINFYYETLNKRTFNTLETAEQKVKELIELYEKTHKDIP